MGMDRSRSSRSGQKVERPRLFGFSRVNIALLAAAVVAVIVGYLLLDAGSTTAAPLLLLVGYAVLVPAGLLWGLRDLGDGDADAGE